MMRPTLRIAFVPMALFLLLVPVAHSESGGIQPSADEQHGIYTINRARSDPEAYGDEIGLDLTGVKAQPPLAVSKRLTASARSKTDEMLANDYFAHTSEVTGLGPNQYIVDAGYDLFANGLGKDWGTANSTESLA